MLSFFDAKNVEKAHEIFMEVRQWIYEEGIPPLKKWWKNSSKKWDLLKNYFTFKVTTAVSEGLNHVIKSLKRRNFGFRTIRYFRLKILQTVGFLNSRFMNDDGSLTNKAIKLFGCDDIVYYQEFALN
jgi:transposase